MSFTDLTDEQKESLRGPAGKDGTDYVLTEADKAEIAEMVEIPEVESVAVDGTTIIKNADGTISTAIGGYEIAGEEMFAWEGSLASGASAAIDISVFEDEFVDMDGDTATISFVLDDEEYEEEYDISATETEIVFENIKAELTTITVNLKENTITVEHGGELLSSLVISSAAGYETINPNFIPVGSGLRRTASDIRLDDTYIEGIIEDMGGTGGSVAIDGVTIVENDNGEICAVIGGGKVIAEKATPVFEYEDEIGFTQKSASNTRFISNQADYLSDLDTSIIYTVNLEFRNATTGETGNCEGTIMYNASNTLYPWKATDLSVFDCKITDLGYNASQGIFLVGSSSYYQVYYITYFAIVKPETYDYNKIDANYIPAGSGLQVGATGELETTLGGLDMVYGLNLVMVNNSYSSSKNQAVVLGQSNTVYDAVAAGVAIGQDNWVSGTGSGSTAIGRENHVSGWGSAAFGYNNYAGGYGINKAQAIGVGCIASSQEQTVYGKWNVEDTSSTYTVIIGNGTDSTNRANGLTMDASGNVVIQGTVSANGGEKLMTESEVRALIQEIMNGGV